MSATYEYWCKRVWAYDIPQTHSNSQLQWFLGSKSADYIKTKAYRPIVLENTLSKVMESITADLFSYSEMHELLPILHCRGCPWRSAEDVIMTLSESIHKAWKEKKVVFMDVVRLSTMYTISTEFHSLKQGGYEPTLCSGWVAFCKAGVYNSH